MSAPLLIVLILVPVIGGLAAFLLLRRANKTDDGSTTDNDHSWVDVGRDAIPLDDENDATSLMFSLTMKAGGAVSMTWRQERGEWEIWVDNKLYSAPTQIEALRKAHLEVDRP